MTVQAQEQKQGDPFDFIRGQESCKDGKTCPEGATRNFERGYEFEYQMQEVNSKQAERAYESIC